jgi:cytochrome c oxidase subunit II
MGSILDPVAGVDRAFLYIFGFAFALLTFVTILMIYFVIRFRASRNPVPEDIRGNTMLEVVWMVIPTLIALSMFYIGWQSYMGLRNVPPDALSIETTGQMFNWTFKYPNGKESDGKLVVPEGKAVKLNITSMDVLHSLSIPAHRIKMDAVPNMTTHAWFRADRLGEYNILCTEYCGVAHSEMLAKLVVVPEADYLAWLEKKPESVPAAKSAESTVPATAQFATEEMFEIGEKVKFRWAIDGNMLNIILSGETGGWLAVGFNPQEGMKGANFILGAVVDGQVLLTDHFGTEYTKHEEDRSMGGKADVINVHGKEENGITEIGFSIPLDSGDAMDGKIVPDGETIILLATNATKDSFRVRHTYRGMYEVNLSTGAAELLD